MNKLTKIVAAIGLVGFIAGCSVNNSGSIDFDADNINYYMDSRTDICYAVTASRKTGDWNATGLGMTTVECTEEVMNLVNQ